MYRICAISKHIVENPRIQRDNSCTQFSNYKCIFAFLINTTQVRSSFSSVLGRV